MTYDVILKRNNFSFSANVIPESNTDRSLTVKHLVEYNRLSKELDSLGDSISSADENKVIELANQIEHTCAMMCTPAANRWNLSTHYLHLNAISNELGKLSDSIEREQNFIKRDEVIQQAEVLQNVYDTLRQHLLRVYPILIEKKLGISVASIDWLVWNELLSFTSQESMGSGVYSLELKRIIFFGLSSNGFVLKKLDTVGSQSLKYIEPQNAEGEPNGYNFDLYGNKITVRQAGGGSNVVLHGVYDLFDSYGILALKDVLNHFLITESVYFVRCYGEKGIYNLQTCRWLLLSTSINNSYDERNFVRYNPLITTEGLICVMSDENDENETYKIIDTNGETLYKYVRNKQTQISTSFVYTRDKRLAIDEEFEVFFSDADFSSSNEKCVISAKYTTTSKKLNKVNIILSSSAKVDFQIL